jgi:hypothetical protein
MAKRLMRRGEGLKTTGLGPAISKWSAEAQRIVTSKTPVRRLQRRDPANAMTDPTVANQFTNNPNLKYQPTGVIPSEPPLSPSGPPGATKKAVPKPRPPSTRNKGKVIKKALTPWSRR